ncbi:MAG: threonylcarbamoyl-AMP synthase [Gemmataceae bacterium]|nr:threonylcarbamoyl-AMP synthase [Gemmataceae bacterium]
MQTSVLRIDPAAPEAGAVRRAADLLRAGRLVAFPTETVYGLGANALDPAAVAGIFAAKGRPATNPVIVHVARPWQLGAVAADWPVVADRLANRFWPGPLTIVVPKREGIPDIVTAGGPTVAVRCPNHAVAQALIREAGVAIAAPSANRSTELSPTRAEHVLKGLDGRIDLILDGGPCPGGIESTVVDVTGGAVRLLRPGLVTVPMLEEVVGPLAGGGAAEGVARSPGRMAKHYSPRTPVVLAADADDADRLHRELLDAGLRVISVGDDLIYNYLSISNDPTEYAADLYAVLHELDDGRYDRIVVEMPPDTPEWAAVRDRLTRAASLSESG